MRSCVTERALALPGGGRGTVLCSLGRLCRDPAWLSPLGPSVQGPRVALASWAICVGTLRGSHLLATVSNVRASVSISLRLCSFIPLAVIPGVKCLILF